MEQKTNGNNNSKTRIIIVLVSVLVCGGIGAALYLMHGANRIITDDAYIEGRIHSIAPKIAGTVIKVNVEDNQGVKKGDTLVELDPEDYQARLNEKLAALDAEKARLLDAEAGIKTAMANLAIQEVALKQAELDKKRAEALFKEEVITKERMEKTSTAYDLSAAQVKAAGEQLKKTESAKAVEESLVKQREVELETARLNLTYAKIFAPSDGYITKKSVEEGNQVQAGQPLMAVVALDDIWVVANYKETQLKNVKTGQKAEIKVDTYPGKIFTGRVDSIMAGTGAVFSLFPPENALGNYVKVVQRIPVKIVFDKSTDKEHVLRIGMSCLPTILIKNE